MISGAYINIDLYDALKKALRTDFEDTKKILLDAILEAISDCDEEEKALQVLIKNQPMKTLEYLREYHYEDMLYFVLDEEAQRGKNRKL